jgi:hypothetical protein
MLSLTAMLDGSAVFADNGPLWKPAMAGGMRVGGEGEIEKGVAYQRALPF